MQVYRHLQLLLVEEHPQTPVELHCEVSTTRHVDAKYLFEFDSINQTRL